MTDQLRRPLLVGGLTLALAIWCLDVLNHLVGELGIYALVVGAIATGVWWLQQRSLQNLVVPTTPVLIDSAILKRVLTEAEQVITQLETETLSLEQSANPTGQMQVSLLQAQLAQMTTDLNRDNLRLIVLGGKGSGKTALVQQLQTAWAGNLSQTVTVSEAPSFFAGTPDGLTADILAAQQAMSADLALFLVTADLTESELKIVQRLSAEKRTLLVFNKHDQYPPEERQAILAQLQNRMQGILATEDLVAIAAAPNPLKVRQHQSDGLVNEWLEDQQPAIAALTQRLDQILQQERQKLVLASSYGCAVALKTQAKAALNDMRRLRALPIVEQFQWIAAATAFASPLPTVDVLATAAINAQMVMDLGAIYQQRFSLQQAQKLTTTLGSLILKLGLVELSTQAIAGLLKSNAFTYVAGGCIQGISAAYLTRITGFSLIEYFHSQDPYLSPTDASPLAIDRFSQVLQRVFQQNQQGSFLQTFVRQAIGVLAPAASQPQLAAAPIATVSNLSGFLPDHELQIVGENRSV
jgi:hypothetical protein